MDFWNALSIICTIVSGVGAWRSLAYYKKSRQITIYANTNIAYVESQKIISTLNEMLKLSNERIKPRGIKSYCEKVSANGESIKNSRAKIREIWSVEEYKDIENLLNSQELEVNKYIDSFITGSILVDEKLIIDDNFNICQKKFYDMQLMIKEKLEKISEKLK